MSTLKINRLRVDRVSMSETRARWLCRARLSAALAFHHAGLSRGRDLLAALGSVAAQHAGLIVTVAGVEH